MHVQAYPSDVSVHTDTFQMCLDTESDGLKLIKRCLDINLDTAKVKACSYFWIVDTLLFLQLCWTVAVKDIREKLHKNVLKRPVLTCTYFMAM